MAPQPPPQKILFLAANPKNTSRLRLDEEIRNIQEGLKLSTGRDNFELVAQWAVRPQDLRRALLEHDPQIVHFSGHGAGELGLMLENELGQGQPMSSAVLANLFKLCPSVDCVVLNACYSKVQATAIADHIPYVIGMNQAIGDTIAIDFAVGFYDALGYGRPIPEAYEFGMTAIEAEPSIITRSMSAYPEVADVMMPNPTIPILIQSERSPQPVRSPVNLSKKEYRDRTALLNKVKSYWIKGVLERSLHNQILIELGLEERLDFADPFNIALGMVHQPQQSLPSGTQVINIFDELGEGRSLLLLGEPGAGKTITLLHLTQELLTRAEQDVSHLIPVVFNLSSWKEHQPIKDWLIEELNTKYQVPRPIGKPWVEGNAILLLLDGLDEVSADHREACVVALNQFQQTQGAEMVVCSRIRDYESLDQRLTIQQAIYVRSLQPFQINQYLEHLNADLAGLKQLLETDKALQELAQSPLMLNIMVLAYEGLFPEKLPKMTVEEHRQRIFNTYIHRMLDRRKGDNTYLSKQIVQWLSWLAQQMVDYSQTIFYIELLDRAWLTTPQKRWLYIILSSLMAGLAWGVIIAFRIQSEKNWIPIGLLAWVIYTIANIFMVWTTLTIERMKPGPKRLFWLRFTGSLWTGILTGLMFGMSIGFVKTAQLGWIVAGITTFTIGALDWLLGGTVGMSFLRPIEALRWSWKNIRNYILFALLGVAPFGLIMGYTKVLGNNPLEGFLLTMFGGLVTGVLIGLRSSTGIETRTIPNQGTWRSAKTAVITAISILLSFFPVIVILRQWLFIPPGMTVFYSLFMGLLMGGSACIVHLSLRIVFYLFANTPWNYVRFLDFSTELAFLQKVGGGYIFIHRSLMEYFAQLKSLS